MNDHIEPLSKPQRPPLRLTLVNAAAEMMPLPLGAVRVAVRRAPRGDGHPVLVLPGFLHTDGNTLPLRRFLKGCGYAVYGWKLGVNVGPTERALDGIERKLLEVQRRHGRTVSLIGHSLGGAMAREVAKQHPERVRQLILLASPIRLPTASPLEPMYRLLARWHKIDAVAAAAQLNLPPEVPVTALYTRSDGIVAWQSCREVAGPQRESIEIRGSHGTMARNPRAWRIIADRLAQAAGIWGPYLGK